MIFNANHLHEQTLIENSLHSPKSTWKAVKDIAHISKKNTIPSELLEADINTKVSIEAVNSYFLTVAQELCNKINQSHSSPYNGAYSIDPSVHSLVLLPADEVEIGALILGLKSDSASGWDKIPPKYLKITKDIIVAPLTKLFNMCIDCGQFPLAFKKSIIHPIYKSGHKMQLVVIGQFKSCQHSPKSLKNC